MARLKTGFFQLPRLVVVLGRFSGYPMLWQNYPMHWVLAPEPNRIHLFLRCGMVQTIA